MIINVKVYQLCNFRLTNETVDLENIRMPLPLKTKEQMDLEIEKLVNDIQHKVPAIAILLKRHQLFRTILEFFSKQKKS